MSPSQSFPPADYSRAAELRDRRFSAIPSCRTLPDVIAYNRARFGRYDALLFDGVRQSNEALIDRGSRLARAWSAAGVGPGDRVVVNLANSPEV